MDALADRLLSGPRGRRFLMELLAPADSSARQTVSFASRGFADPGASFSWFTVHSDSWEPPRVTAAQAAAALAELPTAAPDGAGVLHALRDAVDDAMYWQAPGGEEVLASQPELDEVLARMAAVVADTPVAAWLDAPLAAEDQHRVRWPETEIRHDEPRTWEVSGPAAQVLGQWGLAVREEESKARRERPADPHDNWSGTWWSVPPLPLVSTTRNLGTLGPVGLHLVEDSFGEEQAVTVPVTVPPRARVLEISCAEDWAELCRRRWIDVTASKRHDWFRCTGRHGDWVVPDWERVAAEYDGVHLTAAAYLEGSGRTIAIDDDRASVIAGWNPDATVWLTDVTRPDHPETPWARPEDGDWVRA